MITRKPKNILVSSQKEAVELLESILQHPIDPQELAPLPNFATYSNDDYEKIFGTVVWKFYDKQNKRELSLSAFALDFSPEEFENCEMESLEPGSFFIENNMLLTIEDSPSEGYTVKEVICFDCESLLCDFIAFAGYEENFVWEICLASTPQDSPIGAVWRGTELAASPQNIKMIIVPMWSDDQKCFEEYNPNELLLTPLGEGARFIHEWLTYKVCRKYGQWSIELAYQIPS